MGPDSYDKDWPVKDSAEDEHEGTCESCSLASWDLVGDPTDSVSEVGPEWALVDCSASNEAPSEDLEDLLRKVVGPLRQNGLDYSQISFLIGEWVDSLGHFVKVVATGETSARACISWDHSGQYLANLWKATLKVWRDENGDWTCGNGRLAASSLGRLCWERSDGTRTEWIRRFPASAAFLSAYLTPPPKSGVNGRRRRGRGVRRARGGA
mmetsp:Transcript_67760/g.150061  ORF Transcript_67760/g.150061 Transcript_67760/m.150061 type:complete len:210 (-) Transcript_67760:132-761(-)